MFGKEKLTPQLLASYISNGLRFLGDPQGSTKSERAAAQVSSIIEKGGPESLAEYLRIFPDACQNCGHRTFSRKFWVETPGYSSEEEPYEVSDQCLHCQTWKDTSQPGFIVDEYDVTVDSEFLPNKGVDFPNWWELSHDSPNS